MSMEPNVGDTDNDTFPHHLIPSSFIPRRNRTESMNMRISNMRAQQDPKFGIIKNFCRNKGYGFIIPEGGEDDIFVHIADIEGNYVPLAGDKVTYVCAPLPPKMEKFHAVHVHIVNFAERRHQQWNDTEQEL